jgi:3',5'-cyclic AMP phosphodiesterase CpdA
LARRAREERWDLLVMGGDLVEEATREQIGEAAGLCRGIECPTLICLGNHDVNQADALEHWRSAIEGWPEAKLADARVDVGGVTVLGLSNPWVDALGVGRLYWEPATNPVPTLWETQWAWLEAELGRGEGPAIVCVHCPTHAIPPEQTGLAGPIHESPEAYGKMLESVLGRHGRVKLVLSGHNHASCAVRVGRRVQASVSAISEVPYQYVCVDVDGEGLVMETHRLGSPPTGPEVDASKMWVMGRASDCGCRLPR